MYEDEERIRNFDVTPRVQNSFCTNVVMLHMKSKVMKSRIQWSKTFTLGVGGGGACLGVTGGQKVGCWVLLF